MAFNSKFTPYEGKISGSQVNILIDKIIKSNEIQMLRDESERIIIAVSGEISIDENGSILSDNHVVSSEYYNVKTNENILGLIDNVVIEKATE